MPCLLEKKNIALLTGHHVMSEAELRSRYEITLDNYCKTVHIEARTMVDMARRQILPAVESYTAQLASAVAAKQAVVPSSGGCEIRQIEALSDLTEQISDAVDALASSLAVYRGIEDITEAADLIRDQVLPRMAALRAPCDEAETYMPSDRWPFPTYGDLLFSE